MLRPRSRVTTRATPRGEKYRSDVGGAHRVDESVDDGFYRVAMEGVLQAVDSDVRVVAIDEQGTVSGAIKYIRSRTSARLGQIDFNFLPESACLNP